MSLREDVEQSLLAALENLKRAGSDENPIFHVCVATDLILRAAHTGPDIRLTSPSTCEAIAEALQQGLFAIAKALKDHMPEAKIAFSLGTVADYVWRVSDTFHDDRKLHIACFNAELLLISARAELAERGSTVERMFSIRFPAEANNLRAVILR